MLVGPVLALPHMRCCQMYMSFQREPHEDRMPYEMSYEDNSSTTPAQYCSWSHGGNRFFLAGLGARIFSRGRLAHCCLATGILALRQGQLSSFSEAVHLNSHSGPCSPWGSAEYTAFRKD